MVSGCRLMPMAIETSQVVNEDYTTELNEDTKFCAIEAKRVTVTHKDVKLAVNHCRYEERSVVTFHGKIRYTLVVF